MTLELTMEDMTTLIQNDETSRLKIQGIALQRYTTDLEDEVIELKALLSEVACGCED